MCKCLQIICAKYYELRCMFKKIHLVNVGECLKRQNCVIFGLRFDRRKVDKKANLHEN